MKKLFLALVVIVALGMAVSCGGGGGGGGTGSGYLGGTWSGTWISTVGPWTGVVHVTLNQNGLAVSGSGYITDEGIRYNGSGSGTVTNATGPGNIILGMTYSGSGLYSLFTGQYNAATITGKYEDTGGDRGTFVLYKQ